MANYFSSQPLDYGSREISQGYASLANSISSAGKQMADAAAEKDKMAMADSLMAKRRREEEIQRQMDNATSRGIQPVFKAGADGKPVFDDVATGVKVLDAQNLADIVKVTKETSARIKSSNDEQDISSGFKPELLAPGQTRTDWYVQARNASDNMGKAKLARESIAALKGEFPTEFSKIDPTTATDAQALGMLPQLTGQAALLRRNETEGRTQKNVDYKAGISKQIRELAAQRNNFLDAGQPVPAELDEAMSLAADKYNSSRQATDLQNPVVAEAMSSYSKRPLMTEQAKTIREGIVLLDQGHNAVNQIDAAVNILGGGDKGMKEISKYFGLGELQARELLSRVALPDDKKEQVLSALQGLEVVRGLYRKELYAGALTGNEEKLFDVQAGTPNNKDFIQRSRVFLDNARKRTSKQISTISDSGFYIPKEITSQLDAVGSRPQSSASAVAPASTLPAGWTIKPNK